MDERPIWLHKFSRKKQIPHGSIHPLPQHILLVKFRTVKTKMIKNHNFSSKNSVPLVHKFVLVHRLGQEKEKTENSKFLKKR